MQEKHLFEYSIIRVMPQVQRQEFINVGIILYCSSKRFLEVALEINKEKLMTFSANLNLFEVEERLQAFKKVCTGGPEGGAIGKLPIASRFRWLTAARSTIVQTSPVHPGLCINPYDTLIKLHAQLVQ
jgi:hypothetical protein